MPRLPESFETMGKADQQKALEQYHKRELHYYYFIATYKHNKPHYDAMKPEATMPKQKLVEYASAPWESDNISLKAELIRAIQNWSVLAANNANGSVPKCPIDFSDDEVAEYLSLQDEQYLIDVNMEKIRDRIGISTDGWTANERYEDALEENEHVKTEALATLDDDASKKEFLENWPLDDHDESWEVEGS
ncbi:protein kinase subdomain-containing protein [Glarea lozoyensis ATCC 20868]|uniref:Protein kinase subdomain-containing protein n=1 Tax=Glarea lozoyensis (strain ATCC 20868 / MF5171) TaxID=1116229 RepID=S3EFM0_GLAL2|nr:protein kinase subdomain-containing protein [Glarea lozoyensis ATCC 20868]EPE36983.1 protein kinase subdomain-containing protein [Glarea lozoyensis ATCC 20868]